MMGLDQLFLVVRKSLTGSQVTGRAKPCCSGRNEPHLVIKRLGGPFLTKPG